MEHYEMDTIFLKQWRIYAGLTQEELGSRMGITGTQISRIEGGKRDFDGRFLMAFKHAINDKLDTYWPDQPSALLRITHIADALCVNPDLTTWVRMLSSLERQAKSALMLKTLPTGS